MKSSHHFEVLVLEQGQLFERLEKGHCLLTGNNRLGKITRDRYIQWRLDRGDECWTAPRIYSFRQWLDQLWEEAGLRGHDGTDCTIPGDQQLGQLWQLAVNKSAQRNALLHVAALTTQLRDTRVMAREWQLDFDSPAWQTSENENHQAFLSWNSEFETLCRTGQWLPPEDRIAILTSLSARHTLYDAPAIDLLGFDEITPAQQSLLEAMTDRAPVTQLSQAPRKTQGFRWSAEDAPTELDVMARWARHLLESRTGTDIAVIVPDLAQRRDEVERALKAMLHPADHSASSGKAWNISLGEPLDKQAMIQAAFLVLALLDFRFDIQQASRVLRSPWIRGAETEMSQRALLEKCLRREYPKQLSVYELRYRAAEMVRFDVDGREIPEADQQPRAWNCPMIASITGSLIAFNERHKGAMPPSAWAEIFDGLLASVGWPLSSGARSAVQRSRDWQILQAWNEALAELASLDNVRPSMRRSEAVQLLRQVCRQKVFQAKSPHRRLQVLGVYEASGLQFDHVWVLGLHHGSWPRSAQPNPFIPQSMQRDGGLPHCSPQREYEVAETVTRRLLNSSGQIIFSAPLQIDGEDVLPSPLIRMLPPIGIDEMPRWTGQSWLQRVSASQGPETEVIVMPGPVSAGVASGGSRILRNQALCPFRAFAENRLQAEPLDAPAQGISAAQHGSLLHRSLEGFWKQTVSHSSLMSLGQQELERRIEQHIEAAIGEDHSLRHRNAFREVESARLKRHMIEYLELEKQREPFEAIAFEKILVPDIEGQAVRLIIDRIDQLESGGLAIIDYKSGKVNPSKWFGERPEDPQLPLYAIHAGQTPNAVVLAVIREDGCQFKGVTRRQGLFPGLPPGPGKTTQYLVEAGEQLPATIEQWRETLQRLMQDFLAGDARVEPKNGRKTCASSYCALQSLCRIDELDPLSALAEEPSP